MPLRPDESIQVYDIVRQVVEQEVGAVGKSLETKITDLQTKVKELEAEIKKAFQPAPVETQKPGKKRGF